MADITRITMGDYKKRLCEDNGPGIVSFETPVERSLELKGHILSMLKDIPFPGKNMKMQSNTSMKLRTLQTTSMFRTCHEIQCYRGCFQWYLPMKLNFGWNHSHQDPLLLGLIFMKPSLSNSSRLHWAIHPAFKDLKAKEKDCWFSIRSQRILIWSMGEIQRVS